MPTPQEALSAALDRWNTGGLDGYLSLYDEGIRLHGYSPEPMDKVQVRGWCVERFSQADMLGLLIQIGAVPAPA